MFSTAAIFSAQYSLNSGYRSSIAGMSSMRPWPYVSAMMDSLKAVSGIPPMHTSLRYMSMSASHGAMAVRCGGRSAAIEPLEDRQLGVAGEGESAVGPFLLRRPFDEVVTVPSGLLAPEQIVPTGFEHSPDVRCEHHVSGIAPVPRIRGLE